MNRNYQISRQANEQRANVANGKCRFHKGRVMFKAGRCLECYAKTGVRRPHPGKEKWDQADWSQRDEVIAVPLDVTVSAVRYQRILRFGKPWRRNEQWTPVKKRSA